MNPKQVEDKWAKVLAADQGKAVAAVVQTGKHLEAAYADIGFGRWAEFLKERVHRSTEWARQYRAIAAHPVLSDPLYASRLPVSYRVLFELSKAPVALLKEALDTEGLPGDAVVLKHGLENESEWSGVGLSPEMTVTQAQAWVTNAKDTESEHEDVESHGSQQGEVADHDEDEEDGDGSLSKEDVWDGYRFLSPEGREWFDGKHAAMKAQAEAIKENLTPQGAKSFGAMLDDV